MKKDGVYSIQVNRVKKEMQMEIVGRWSDEDVSDFARDYQASVNSLGNPKDFTLIADSTDMNVITQDMIPALKDCFEMYKSSGFSKFKIIIKESAIIKMQLNRVLRMANFSNSEIVEV